MIKPPVVYVAGMLRQTGTYIRSDDWAWRLDQMGQRAVLPAERERLGAERGLALDELAAHALPGRGVAAARRRSRTAPIPAPRTPAAGARALAAYAGQPVDEQGDDLRARVATAGAASPAGTRTGRSSTTCPSASACCATCCWPAPTPRSADAARVQRLARDARARSAGSAGRHRADPGGRARRPRRRSSARAASRAATCSRGGVGLLLAANGLPGLSTRGVLEAAAAQAADAPDATILVSLYLDGGNDGLNTLVPLADPRYRELRSRIGIDPATALPLARLPEFGWHPSLAGLRELYDARQGRRAAGGRLLAPRSVALQLGRLLAPRHRRAGVRTAAAGWGARST